MLTETSGTIRPEMGNLNRRLYRVSSFLPMKYYYEKPETWTSAGQIYICDHPLYNRCTLFKKGKKGLAVIQEHFNEKTKARWWGTIEPWLASDIYLNDNFRSVFDQYAKEIDEKSLYPMLTLRKIMWALRMKPLKREYWEEEI